MAGASTRDHVFPPSVVLIGIILSGSNNDGSKGIEIIKKYGGLTIAENPKTSEYSLMPKFAIETGYIDKILTKEEIKEFLDNLSTK